ncbi:MAG: 16S rRNA (guanine(966)-N(2))-methyltransferase RsmD [Pseudomonadota bacterium]
MAKRKQPGQVRIIGGTWRGRKLSVADVPGLRPTTDRIRETLFNWLMPYLGGARVLDAFAGTGVLSFEALSRGARFAELVESDATAARMIQDNIARLGAAANVSRGDARHLIRQGPSGPAFDVVFLDPPFADQDMSSLVDGLVQGAWLAEDALIYIEQESGRNLPDCVEVVRDKIAGGVQFGLYRARREGNS